MIILAEGAGDRDEIADYIQKKSGLGVKVTNFGYIQRGGTPSMQDRVLASRCADRAVELLYKDSKESKVIGIKRNKIIDLPIDEALEIKKEFNKEMLEVASRLAH